MEVFDGTVHTTWSSAPCSVVLFGWLVVVGGSQPTAPPKFELTTMVILVNHVPIRKEVRLISDYREEVVVSEYRGYQRAL